MWSIARRQVRLKRYIRIWVRIIPMQDWFLPVYPALVPLTPKNSDVYDGLRFVHVELEGARIVQAIGTSRPFDLARSFLDFISICRNPTRPPPVGGEYGTLSIVPRNITALVYSEVVMRPVSKFG